MTLTIFLNNTIEICTSLTEIFISVMSVFMAPPLVLYIGIVLFLIIIITIHEAIHMFRGQKYRSDAKILWDKSQKK